MVRKRLYLTCFVLLLVLAFVGAVQAVDFAIANSDFEGGWGPPPFGWMGVTVPPFTVGTIPTGWGTWTGGGNLEDIYVIAGNPAGPTPVGGVALSVLPGNIVVGNGYSFLWTMAMPTIPLGTTVVTMYVDVIDLTPGGAVGNYAGIAITGVEEIKLVGLNNLTNPGVGVNAVWQTFAHTFNVAPTTTQVELKVVNSTNQPPAVPPWTNPPYAPAIYGFDNVRLAPEPATMVLLGLGSLALLKRRKS
jgi:hypothetical protein